VLPGIRVVTMTKEPTESLSLIKMFLLFVKIGIVTIGGGYVMIPLLQQEFVSKRDLMSAKEFCDIMAVAQSGPGGVAINASVVVGYRLRGLLGGVLAVFGTVLPSFLAIVVLASYLLQYRGSPVLESFLAGARPAVVGLLAAAAYSLGREVIEDFKGLALGVGGLTALIVFDIHPVLIIVLSGLLGYLVYRKDKKYQRGASCRID